MAAKAAAVKQKKGGKKNCRSLSVTDGLVVPEKGNGDRNPSVLDFFFLRRRDFLAFPFFAYFSRRFYRSPFSPSIRFVFHAPRRVLTSARLRDPSVRPRFYSCQSFRGRCHLPAIALGKLDAPSSGDLPAGSVLLLFVVPPRPDRPRRSRPN